MKKRIFLGGIRDVALMQSHVKALITAGWLVSCPNLIFPTGDSFADFRAQVMPYCHDEIIACDKVVFILEGGAIDPDRSLDGIAIELEFCDEKKISYIIKEKKDLDYSNLEQPRAAVSL